ncbi:MAG TPA: DUF4325 domain-containing protein [Pyrinomonadaceae bacterium]|nr:DUF4325 domain-containing protein [Pyrinomonadaceae bacterium]
MEIKDKIVISKDFTDTPGARFKSEGDFSGEEFLESILLPRFNKAVKEKYILLINLDNVWGYPSSFISGSFGILSTEKGKDLVLNHIKFESENKTKIEKFIEEIKNPQGK